MLPRTKLLLSLPLFSAVAFAAPRAQADTTIDDFLASPFAAGAGPVTDTGGYRGDRVSSATGGTIGQAIGILTVMDTDVDSNGAIGTVTWPTTSSLAGPDLTTGVPTNDRFVLGIIDTTGKWTASLYADDGSVSGTVPDLALPSGGGTVEFLFGDLLFNGVDFSKVKQLKLTLTELTDFADNNSVRVDYHRAVPEPTTAGMLMLGLLGLAGAGRRREKILA